MTVRAVLVGLAIAATRCTGSSRSDAPVTTPPSSEIPADASPPRAARVQLDGRDFPDRVIALTWDDGPDANTIELARYLHREKVRGTFFVVGAWVDGVSADPGVGSAVFATGHDSIPILGELVKLGHRIGNHTMNHVHLWGIERDAVQRQLRDNQRRIDPFVDNELRLFRAPGGAWSDAASDAVDGDVFLGGLVGPVRWDIDRKDWDASLTCDSERPQMECERAAGPGLERCVSRLKPPIVAQRYFDAIEHAGRGIVLLHDRVGHVGSRYALDVARALVPKLVARGYVFAAPVLAFAPLATRLDTGGTLDAGTARFADVDGDGRADICARSPAGLVCARSMRLDATGGMPHMAFGTPRVWGAAFASSGFELADVDADGRADACVRQDGDVVCALAAATDGFGEARRWAALPPSAGPELRFGDVDGDGRADVCTRAPSGIVCARGTGTAFGAFRTWLADAGDAHAPFELADVTGDRRADLCVAGLRCAPSRGDAFAGFEAWGGRELDGAALADVNGDGRADACALRGETIECALSSGRAFTSSTVWLAGARGLGGLRLADVNGDGRADVCAPEGAGIACALAP